MPSSVTWLLRLRNLCTTVLAPDDVLEMFLSEASGSDLHQQLSLIALSLAMPF